MKQIRVQDALHDDDAAHNHDSSFIMVRFSLRVPIASAILYNGDDDDDDDNDDDDGTRLQRFELCFHNSFFSDESRPVSLHFDSVGPDLVLLSSLPPFLCTPDRPSYVYEIPEVLDLIKPSSSSPSPLSKPPEPTTSLPNRRHLARLLALSIALLVLLSPTPINPVSNFFHWFYRSSSNFSQLRTALAEMLLRRLHTIVTDVPYLFSNLSLAVQAACVNANVLLTLKTAHDGPGLQGLDSDLGLICEALHQRVHHAHLLWSGLPSRLMDDWLVSPLKSLRLAAWTARNLPQDDMSLVGVFKACHHPTATLLQVTAPPANNNTMLPSEGDVIALTRHVLELLEAVGSLVKLLGRQVPAANGESSIVSSSHASHPESTTPTPLTSRPWLWGWFGGHAGVGGGGGAPDYVQRRMAHEESVRNAVRNLIGTCDAHLYPLVCDLSQASAGISLICAASERFCLHLDALERGFKSKHLLSGHPYILAT
ncbi:hypothetical protein LY78DRAFT_687275 [Colletotrichum sublineola]|nr:hypothetical protein LY78DRAFT_687275 [Colletotrichum sublineola]